MKITIEKGTNTETWKAVRGFGDGNTKTDCVGCCGVVIKGVDKNKWITISKIVVCLRMCTAMATEVVGVSVLIEILDFVPKRNFTMEPINDSMMLSSNYFEM